MTAPPDPFWDELGVAWSALDPNIRVIASRLQVRLRRQTQWLSVVFVIGLLFGAMGLLLGLATLGIGASSGTWNFVTRGIGLITISAILLPAVWSLQPIRAVEANHALAQMIDLAIERARKTLSLVKAGLYACALAAIFGLVGTAIRTHFGRPPKVSPIIDLAVVGLIALALALYRWKVQVERRKYRMLKQALAVDAEA